MPGRKPEEIMKQYRLFSDEDKSAAGSGFLQWMFYLMVLLSLLLCAPAFAQKQEYLLYLDSDRNSVTGCTVLLPGSGGAAFASGFEYVLRVGVDDRVGALELAACESGEFGAYRTVAPEHGLALTGSGDLTDHIEIALPLSYLPAADDRIRIVVSNHRDSLMQVAADEEGEIVVGPLNFSGRRPSPASLLPLPALVLLALGGLIALFGGHGRSPRPQTAALSVAVIAASLLSMGLAWAQMRIDVGDGSIGDWNGIEPLAIGSAGDHAEGSARLLRFYAVSEDRQLKMRIDAKSGRTVAPPPRPFVSDPLGLLPQLAPIPAPPADKEAENCPAYCATRGNETFIMGIAVRERQMAESEGPTG